MHKQSGPRTFSTLSARRHFQVPISGHSPHWAIVEDYSEFGIDEDDEWQEKFADFKMKTSVRRGLFHPNDIKPVGLAPVSPSAKSVSLPDVLNAIGHSRTVAPTEPGHPVVGIPFTGPTGTRSHSWSPSFAGSSSGSFGRSDVRRLASQEFNKYAEDDDEDYDVCSQSRMDLVRALFIYLHGMPCYQLG